MGSLYVTHQSLSSPSKQNCFVTLKNLRGNILESLVGEGVEHNRAMSRTQEPCWFVSTTWLGFCSLSEQKWGNLFLRLPQYPSSPGHHRSGGSLLRVTDAGRGQMGYWWVLRETWGLPQWLSGKQSTCNAGEAGVIPGLGRSPGGGYGSPLQYSCLDNPTDREAWWATVDGVTKSWTQLKRHAMHARKTWTVRHWQEEYEALTFVRWSPLAVHISLYININKNTYINIYINWRF